MTDGFGSARAWYLGNTTVRSPLRIRAGLIALVQSPLRGNLGGRANEQAFARLLHDEGVVSVVRLGHEDEAGRTGEADASDVGRKWRVAMTQLGFLTPAQEVLDRVQSRREPFTVTEAGRRLISAEIVVAQQECFLRALLAHRIPSPIEQFPGPVFSPVRIVLESLHELERQGLGVYIHKEELVIVELVRRLEDVPEAVRGIASLRAELAAQVHDADRARFLRTFREQHQTPTQSGNTLKDYADSNFRYLKATGLFVDRNSRLEIAPQKATTVQLILAAPYISVAEGEYVERLWHGAELPTDRREEAERDIASLARLLTESGAPVRMPQLAALAPADLSQFRHALEQQYANVMEGRWAERQARELPDIGRYLHALTTRNHQLIPRGEAPAYLEWAVWRAFLAIDSLVNAPWDARQFPVDPSDFTPVGNAPPNRPDMVFEFEDWVAVVEVTLLGGSRQEAAEGEPVRRHVADVVRRYGPKPVYGLFVANLVDLNTVETFRHGVWYAEDGSRLDLRIVPMTLEQFARLLPGLFEGQRPAPHLTVRRVLHGCVERRLPEAPAWRRAIDQYLAAFVSGNDVT